MRCRALFFSLLSAIPFAPAEGLEGSFPASDTALRRFFDGQASAPALVPVQAAGQVFPFRPRSRDAASIVSAPLYPEDRKQIQDLFQEEMARDGYFDEQKSAGETG